MKKIFGFLMQQKRAVFLILILLIIQAICELSLPQYTSNIVDVGIMTSGIDCTVPDCIRETQLTAIKSFLFREDLENVESNYVTINHEKLSTDDLKTYEKKYPLIVSENICEWRGNEEQRKELEIPFAKAILAISALSKEGMDISVVASMPADQREGIIRNIDTQLNGLDDSMITNMAISYTTSEYETIGLDMEAIQNRYILTTGGKMIGLSLLVMFVTIIVCYLSARAAGSIGRDLRSRIFKKVVSFSNTELDRFSTASLITRSTNDIQQVQMVSVFLLRIVIYAPILGIGGILKVMDTDTSMTWIIAVGVVMIILLVGLLFLVAMPKFKLMQTLVDKLNLVTREILTGIPVIRAFSTEKYEEKRFDKANKDLTKTMLFTTRAMTLMMPSMSLLINGITLAIVWFGAKNIDTGSLQVGEMLAFITYAMQIVMSFLMITMVSIMLPRAGVAANRISEVLQTEPILHDPENPKDASKRGKGIVEFDHVSFRYPDADGYTLHDISFTAKPGETTAIIGSTGSGKSTLVNLIPRFYDVTEGTVKIDGIDVREMKQSSLRDKLGFVPQKAVLFTGTIASNIKYGKENADLNDIKNAARIAQSTDFIEAKEEQYDSPIAQGGNNVSGGQKQRLSIARAIAREPEILVFDDSFSALDFKTDVALRKALKEETNQSTVIVVAQRISTILNAEQILVLDEGRIVGKGTHAELMENCDVYYEIATSQLSSKELEAYHKEGQQ